MIQLFQFPRVWDIPNASLFCLKMETYLRLANIPYEVKEMRNPRHAPKGKLPFIIDGDKKIADSSFIICYLKKTYGDKLDSLLTPEQKALALSVKRMMEEHLYWIIFYSRWVPSENWNKIKDDFFYGMPILLKWFVPNMIRKNCIKAVYNQGIGRLNDDERFQSGKADIDSVVTLLGSQSYFFGDSPTSIDCSVWGIVTNLLNSPVKDKLQDYAKTIQTLTDYDARMRARFDELSHVKKN